MRVLCPAKINLHLRVGRRRQDGFHPLSTWMVTVGLFDTLKFEETRTARAAGSEPSPSLERAGARTGEQLIALSSDLPGLAGDASNLVVRAAHVLAGAQRDGEVSRELTPVRATLEKVIPLGAGLGGGSSDAARTLIALNRLWGMNWPAEKLAPLAAKLGSDVPFFLFGSSSICTGRGEVVRPVTPPRVGRWCVLMLPEIHMPTAAVYKRFDELGLGFDREIEHEPHWAEWSVKKSKDLLLDLVNDLEAPAFEIRADLGKLRADVELRLGRTVRMSGSGSSLFTLFDEKSDAAEAAESVEKKFGVRAIAVQLAPELRDDVGSM